MSGIRKGGRNNNVRLKQVLNEFTLEISAIRTRKELIHIIHEKLTRLIAFNDVVISLADQKNGTHTSFIYYSTAGGEQKGNFFKMTTSDYRLDDGFYNVTLDADYPVVWDLNKVMGWKSVPGYLAYAARNGTRKILGISLKSVQGNLGCLFFLSEDQDAFTNDELVFVGEIVNQLSGALINIRFVEEIEKRERDKEILLDAITHIASIRDRTDLNKVVDEHLKKVFTFNDLAIPILNGDRLTHKVYIKHFEKERKISKELAGVLNLGKCSVEDGILDVVLSSYYPMVWIIEDVLKWDRVPLYVKFWSENCMKKMAGVAIRSKGETLGAILFCSDSLESFRAEDLSKVNAISNQLSVAVLNILINEEMQKREHEKEILLSLSNDIAAIRNKKELLSIVKEKLKSLLPFNDIVITVRHPDKRYHHTFIYDFEAKRSGHRDFDRLIKSPYLVEDGVINVTMQADQPVNLVVEELLKNDFVPEYLTYYDQTGVKEIVGVAMRNGREEVGGLFLVSEQAQAFSPQHLNLIKSISSQLCIVISNIIANDTIIERERDVSVLLTFSNEISTVRDRTQLQAILNSEIKRLIPFVKIAIILFDQEHQRYHNFLLSAENETFDAVFGNGELIYTPLGDALMERTRRHSGPVIFGMEELRKKKLVNTPLEMDPEQLIGIAMQNGNQFLGGLYLFAEREGSISQKDYNLLQGIADQLSFTVINILANENILKREREKTILLEMSKDIAKVRNKSDLQRIVNEKLKRLLPYSHTLAIGLDDDGQSALVFLEGQETWNSSDPEFAAILKNPIPVNDGILDVALLAEHPVVFDLEEMIGMPGIPRYVTLNYALGIRSLIVAPFSDGKRNIGLLIIFSREKHRLDNNHLNLIQGLSSQLSIAMSNIIANEKIERQILEISGFKQQLEVENLYLQEEIYTTHNYSEIIGTSKAMNEVFRLISQVSETQSSVLLLGETGTGKELFARAIHNHSPRKGKVMVKVNCATLPANLIESELFGHERGSFTGATDKRIGKFELANNSTLFLDEIGELPLELQVKLLRALQEKEIERVGGRSVIKTDVRVIAATNRDLAKEVQLGNFRSDLFFRLNIFPITIPPLRNRKDDIPILAAHFLEKHNKKSSKKVMGFSHHAIRELMDYDWPGNVRELEHLIERTILMTSQPTINHLHLSFGQTDEREAENYHSGFKTIDEIEREHIMAVLKSCHGKVAGAGGAAEILKLPATTIHSKMKRLGIGKKYAGK